MKMGRLGTPSNVTVVGLAFALLALVFWIGQGTDDRESSELAASKSVPKEGAASARSSVHPPTFALDRVSASPGPVATGESVATEGSSAPPPLSVVVARLRTPGGDIVNQGRIELIQRDQESRFLEVNELGEALFEDIPSRRCFLRLIPDSLEDGMVSAVGNYSLNGIHSLAYDLVVADPLEGKTAEVLLTAYPASRLSGYLLGPDGEGVPSAHVRLQCLERGLQGVAPRTLTDSKGWFELVDLSPGKYRAQFDFDPRIARPLSRSGKPFESLPRPMPMDLELDYGEQRSIELRMEPGPNSIRGLVRNPEGEPYSNLRVICYYRADPEHQLPGVIPHNLSSVAARALTDESGVYVLKGVHAEEIAIQIEPLGYIPSRPVGKNVIGAIVGPIYMDLRRQSGLHRAPDRVAHPCRPFRVKGKVEIDSKWAAETRFRLRDLKLTVWREDPRVWRASDRRKGARFDLVEISEDGAFEWACETPQDYIGFELVDSRKRADPRLIEHVVAEPDGELPDFRISYP